MGALQGMGSSRVALKGPTSRLGGKFQGQVHMGGEPGSAGAGALEPWWGDPVDPVGIEVWSPVDPLVQGEPTPSRSPAVLFCRLRPAKGAHLALWEAG